MNEREAPRAGQALQAVGIALWILGMWANFNTVVFGVSLICLAAGVFVNRTRRQVVFTILAVALLFAVSSVWRPPAPF